MDNTKRITDLESRMTASENRERLESRELVEVGTQLKGMKDTQTAMNVKLDAALEYIAQQKGREMQNRTFYSLGGGLVGSIVSYYLTKWGGGNGGG